jgi:hypothetical protein
MGLFQRKRHDIVTAAPDGVPDLPAWTTSDDIDDTAFAQAIAEGRARETEQEPRIA